jgi:Sec-independent protein translocase protein TatA
MPSDLVLVLVIVLVLVLIWRGPKTLPVLGQALGRGVKEAKREASELRTSTDPEPDQPASGAPAAPTSDEPTPPGPPTT